MIFPHNIGLGATRDADARGGDRAASPPRRSGPPASTGPSRPAWPCRRTSAGAAPTRASPRIPKLVRRAGRGRRRAASRAAASTTRWRVLACAKHYVGRRRHRPTAPARTASQGASARPGRHAPRRGRRCERIHLQGYLTAIEAGVGSIMPSYSSWNGEKCSGSKRLLTDILKGELGFEGFLISDYNAIDQLPGDYRRPDQACRSTPAWTWSWCPTRYREFFDDLKALVDEGRGADVAHRRRGDAHPAREVRHGPAGPEARRNWPTAASQKSFGSAEHRAVARQAVRESLVLLKNDRQGAAAVARQAKRIHVAGKSADDIGNQCGGWTIDLAGQERHVTTGAPPSSRRLQQGAVSKDTQVTYSKDGTGRGGRRRRRGRGRRDALRRDASATATDLALGQGGRRGHRAT